jgi:peptide/nickel transport system permease protein
MFPYLLRRLALTVPAFLVVTVVTFAMLRLIPGDILDLMVQEQNYGGTRDAVRAQLGLDQPLVTQYGTWLLNALHGDLGHSLWTKRPVMDELAWRFPLTLELSLLGIVLALLVAVPIGVLSAAHQDRAPDYVLRTGAIAAVAIPSFWIATLALTGPSILWGWTPPLSYVPLANNPVAHLGILLLPSCILAVGLSGRVMRLTRGMLLEVLREDYIRTARAKGLRERAVLFGHAMRNALIPIVTVIGLEVPFLLGGTVVLEQIFNLPGMGRYMLQSLEKRDYIPAQSIVLLLAAVTMFANLVVDFCYGVLDPRIRLR